ncbi:MAG: hypothetical protein BM564_02180 [Bacteroidetes bacterium MedPE-SWsnd-G2]|nr:MAG: hypothetical protein BM564_02180 [Bacteroidetes bacterium MedPE-SWsnd-G2]
MKLSEDQINKLYEFTKRHYVEYYDVQTELVDHLANGIESQLEEFPNRNFDEALTLEFKKFGVFGFMDIVDSKVKAMNKKYRNLVWHLFKAYFSIPKIVISATLLSVLLILMKLIDPTYVILSASVLVLIVLSVKIFRLKKLQNKRFKETNRKWLLEDMVFNLGASGVFFQLFLQFAIQSPAHIVNNYPILSSIVLFVLMLFMYIIVFVLPEQIEDLLQEEYPEYTLVA